MPPRVDRCVQSLLEDPEFKPKNPEQSKEEAAWALCTWMDQQGYLTDSMVGVKIMVGGRPVVSGPFRVVLPIIGARRELVQKSDGGEEVQLWLHVEASGPERDADGDRMSEAALDKMVSYATEKEIPFLDGHYRDLLAGMLGGVKNPYLTKSKHFAFDALLNSDNPFSVGLFNDVLAGKKHGASIAGVVHAADIEEYENNEFGSLFHDVELIEVSRTSWPSWRDSFITLVASKVGKLPEPEFKALMKRRDEIAEFRSGGDTMLVRTVDGGTEEWSENEAGELIAKITSPHGWDEKFGVSDTSWAEVEDRTKPCQYAIVEENEDGTFSPSKSGYPHHMPDCSTINRGGCIAAAGRLVQALKSNVPALSTPPIVSLVTERIGVEEFILYKQESTFTTEELKYAANHILRHYRQDMDEEPPENLVDVAKRYGSEKEEIISLIKGLVRLIEKTEVIVMKKDKVVETPAVMQEFTVEKQTETVTDPEAQEVKPVEKQEPGEEEVISEPVATEEEVPPEEESALGKIVDGRLLASKFGELIYAMQEMVMESIQGQNLESALKVIEDFTMMSKDVLSQLVVAQQTESVALSFLAPIESRVELATGKLTKSRVLGIDNAIENLVGQLISLRAVVKNADATNDVPAVKIVEPAPLKSEHVKRFEERLDAIEHQRKDEVDKLAKTLAIHQREEPATVESDIVVELTPEERRLAILDRFAKSLKKR